jgi:hypothetical protein
VLVLGDATVGGARAAGQMQVFQAVQSLGAMPKPTVLQPQSLN